MKEYVSVDVETTGLAPKQDKIIEIGAVRVRDGQIVGSFTSFVNPGRILPAHITELTGILQEQVDEAETMESVLPAFLEFAGDLPLVGHRILFDYGFLKRAAVNMRLDFERSGVDTLKLSRQFLSELPSRRLSALCEHFEIPIQAHRALDELQRRRHMDKWAAYLWLQMQLGLSSEETHIGLFSVGQCEQVIKLCRQAVNPPSQISA